MDCASYSPILSESKDTLTRKGDKQPSVSSIIKTHQYKHCKHTGSASVPSWNGKMEPGSFRRLQGWLPNRHDAWWQAGSTGRSHCQEKGGEYHLSPTRINLHLMQVMGVGILAGEGVSEHFEGKTAFCSQYKTHYYWDNQKI